MVIASNFRYIHQLSRSAHVLNYNCIGHRQIHQGPDGISPKLVKEFAYELSSTFNWYLKLFLQRRSFAQAVETSHCCSHTQNKAPWVDKLRPVSLTGCFAKIGEGLWVLEDIQDKIDPQTIR